MNKPEPFDDITALTQEYKVHEYMSTHMRSMNDLSTMSWIYPSCKV